MARLRVDSVLCHTALGIDFQTGVTLVTGKNTSGKTSLARILAALTAHDPNPAHVSATQGKVYVQDGVLEGQASLDEVTWRPPGGISAPPNQEPAATPHAVGLVDFVGGNRAAKERAKLWEGLFLPDEPMAILKPRWSLPESQLAVIVEMIQTRGWEAASAIYEQKRTETKRRWESVTGAGRYGSKKAVTWVPVHWRTELEGAAETDLQSACVDLRDRIMQMGVQQTIEQAKIDEAKLILARDIPDAEAALAEAERDTKDQELGVEDAAERLSAIRQGIRNNDRELKRVMDLLTSGAPHACPECGQGLVLTGGSVGRWVAPSQAEVLSAGESRANIETLIEDGRKKEHGMRDFVDSGRVELNNKRDKWGMAQGKVQVLKAQATFATLEPSQGNDAERARLELQLEEANKSLIAYQQFHNAARERDNVVELDAVCNLLGPTGARAQHMRSAMDGVRLVMRNACAITGWSKISILDDYSLTSGGRPITLCADNERLKAQYTCQIASAMLTQGEWLVLDQADLLRDESWEGLAMLLNRLSAKRNRLNIVVCATSTDCPSGWAHVRLEG